MEYDGKYPEGSYFGNTNMLMPFLLDMLMLFLLQIVK